MAGQKPGRARVRIRWDLVDRHLGRFTAESVVPLLSAAIDSPFLGAVREQLWLVWIRTLRCPPNGTRNASFEDLPDLVAVGISADPRPHRHLIDPADPRLVVRYRCGETRLRVHPGELEHPLVFLRGASTVAFATDPYLVRRLGFGLSDVIELILRASDSYLSHLSPAWPPGSIPADSEDTHLDIGRVITEAEVSAARRAQELRLTDIAASCSHPDRAALALRWLGCQRQDLRVSVRPDGLSLGPVLTVASEGGSVPVPAAFLMQALLAASARLTALAARDAASLRTLRAFTTYRMEELLRGPAEIAPPSQGGSERTARGDREGAAEVASEDWSGQYPAFVGTKFSGVIASYLGHANFWKAIDEARQSAPQVIAEVAAQAGAARTGPTVVIYGGLPALAPANSHEVVCIHVEEFAEMLADAGGDRDMLAQFLQEVSLHPGISSLLFIDVLDVWWHWRDHNMIGPLFVGGAEVAVLPYQGKPDWERAAELEPIENVLARARFPESARWPVFRIDEAGQATMRTPAPGPARAVLVRTDPPLLLIMSLENDGRLGLTPDKLYGLADGIRITAGRHQDIADGLRLADGVPLTCEVSLTDDFQPVTDETEATGIAIAIDHERSRVGLQFGPEFFGWLTDDPQKAHKMVGRVLHHAVAGLSEEPAVDRARFLAAWNATPPVMLIRPFHNTGPASVPADPMPHGEFARGRAFRSIAMAIESATPPSDPLSERKIRAHLTAVVEALLLRRLGDCDPSVITDVARALNAAHAARWRYSHDLQFALSAPWATDWQTAALEGEDPAARIRPLQLLLEFLLLTPPTGKCHPDRYELAELEEIARDLLEQRTRLNAIDVGLSYLLTDPDPPEDEEYEGGPTEAGTSGNTNLRLNFSAYAQARARDRARIRTPTPADTPMQQADVGRAAHGRTITGHPERTFREFEPIASFDPPAHLLATDTLMRENLGTGLDGIRAVLGTAVDWPTDETGIAVIDPEHLAQEAQEWSGLPQAEVDAAVVLLSFDPQSLPEPVHRYWEVERLTHRLSVRPFPVIGSKLLIMPWAAEATQELYGPTGRFRKPRPREWPICRAKWISSLPIPPNADYGSARSKTPKPPLRRRFWAATSNASLTVKVT